MFIGHYALGLAAKRLVPKTSLGTLTFAPTLADLVWPVCLALGWEHAHFVPGPNPFLELWLDSVPISHSLVALLGWGLLCAVLYQWRTGYRRGALVIGLLVASHWVLDFVVHRPDLAFYPGSPRVGLGLWNAPTATVVLEGLMFVVGSWLYLRTTQPRDAWGRYGVVSFVAFLAFVYGVALRPGHPPTMREVEIGGIVFGWLFVGWAAWADRHRAPRERGPAAFAHSAS